MTALHLKDRWDEYKHVSQNDDEEGRVMLTSPTGPPPYASEEHRGLLQPEVVEVQLGQRPKRKRGGCCVCCGIDCSLLWKAIGIVLLILTVWNAFKLVRWALTPAATGLETMPTYSTSLGCLAAPYIYNSSKLTLSARIGANDAGHAFDTRGGAVGTITLAQGRADAKDVVYEMTIRTDDRSLLDNIQFSYPPVEADGSVLNSRLVMATPGIPPGSKSCLRYDIKIFVPPTLKKLHIAPHTVSHVQFDAEARLNLDIVYVTLYATNPNNIILPHADIVAGKMSLEVFRGWIVGEVALSNTTNINTQRGDGVMNVKVIPTAPKNEDDPEVAQLHTTTGAGRTDLFYNTPKEQQHRPIRSTHISSRNADMYFTYKDAGFNGLVELDARSFTTSGLRPFAPREGDVGLRESWTHSYGDQNGGDRLSVSTRGWAGLYF
ncbi:hypothetical protein HGRIS_002202 [Hohenbuehelia grisea]|uniref:Uncharacterized protein n=1 Tax=Hohenbuehelia grisea TaxID=104357 RepID=A0ABR3JJT0_9AGAR